MAPPSDIVLGIDVGGTKTAAGLVLFPDGTVLAERIIPTLAERGSNKVLDDVVDLAGALVKSPPASNFGGTIGLGICELVDPAGRIFSGNAVQWTTDLVKARLNHLGAITIEADVRAAALAESLFGAGRGLNSFLYLTVGTGIASCLMIGGAPYLGASGATGTMASSPITLPCPCCGTSHGFTLEEIASGPALVRRFNQACHGNTKSGEEVLRAAAAGNEVAKRIVTSAAVALGSAVGMLVNVLDPEAVVVGGGLGSSEGLFWESLVQSVPEHVWSPARRAIRIHRASSGPRAGVIGAAASAYRQRVRE